VADLVAHSLLQRVLLSVSAAMVEQSCPVLCLEVNV